MASLSHTRPHLSAAPIHRNLWLQVFSVWRQRKHLGDLDAHLRRDLGLTEGDVTREAQRPFWDVPQHWRM